jgi:predicted acyltransferase
MSIKSRYLALDVFRGLTVTFMIIVNTSGNGETTYALLQHAAWNGFTPTDLVFPSFMFAVGNALIFSLPKYESIGTSAVLLKILKRTALIFLLGYLMYWFPFFKYFDGKYHSFPISETRIFGVLQRIALGYGIGALVIYFLKDKGALIFSIAALLAYWVILLVFGDLTLENNAVLKLDKWLVGEKHLYGGYGIPFDPEGLLSTLPSIVNVIWGYMAGKYIKTNGHTYETIARLMLTGTGLFFTAYIWNQVFPINKPIWSSSYALLTVGLDLLILSILIYFIEIRQQRGWTYFFEVFGRNTLFCYLLSELIVPFLYMYNIGSQSIFGWIYTHIFQPIGDYRGALAFAICYMLLIWLAGWILDKRKIYIKI